MNFDLNMIPTTFDMLHAGLAASSILLLIIAVSRKSKVVEKVIENRLRKLSKSKNRSKKSLKLRKLLKLKK